MNSTGNPKTHFRANFIRPVAICGLESKDAEALLNTRKLTLSEIAALDTRHVCQRCQRAFVDALRPADRVEFAEWQREFDTYEFAAWHNDPWRHAWKGGAKRAQGLGAVL